jgi:NAD(P)-dependent dehydrogenase (short-subunit alcohol dehydrogenase family)
MADVTDMEKSKLDIIKFTNNPNVFAKHLDLSSLKSVRDFASEILKSEDKLDILINNAGVLVAKNNRTGDGLHPVMQVNYFGHFLLTHLLIGLLKKSASGRIVLTSSLLAFINNLSLKNLNFDCQKPKRFDRFFMYGNSKLSMIMAADTFAEKLKGTGVTVNSVHPGLVKTPIFASRNVFFQMFVWLSQCVLGRVSNWQKCRGVSECFLGPLGRIASGGSRCSFTKVGGNDRRISWGVCPLSEALESV